MTAVKDAMPSNITNSGIRKGHLTARVAGVATGLTVLLLLIAGSGQSQAAGREPNCPNQADPPGQLSLKQMRAAITCLVAFERDKRDREALKPNRALTRIAARHTAVMLKDECFDHKCPGEQDLQKRITESNYLKGGGRYGFAENLGCAQSAQAQVIKWMESPGHKRNILGRKYRHIGVGVGKGAPTDCAVDRGYATYTVIFAWRKR